MTKIISLYNSALKIRKACSLQREVFRYWRMHNCDPVWDCLAFDTETTGVIFGVPSFLHLGYTDIEVPGPLAFGLSLAVPYKDEIALFWGRLGTPLFSELAHFLGTVGYKAAHNAKYDLRICRDQGIYVAPRVDCTLTMSRIYWDRRMGHSLQKLSEFFCPELSDWEEPIKAEMKKLRNRYTRAGYPKNYVNYSFLPDERIGTYSMVDSFIAFMLNQRLRPHMLSTHREVYKREMQLLPVITKIERRGMRFDCRRARKEIHNLLKQKERLEHRLSRYSKKSYNPHSPVQLLPVLLKNGISKALLTSEGKLTTEKEVLVKARIQLGGKRGEGLLSLVLDLRSTTTLVTRYLLPLLKRARLNGGIIFYSINPADTRTGRMTATNPSMQNLPRPKSGYKGHNPVRACFVCRAGFWMYFFDYVTVELVMLGILANEASILDWFHKGLDLHKRMGRAIFGNKDITVGNLVGTREVAKHVSYAYIFGAGVGGLMRDFRMTEGEANRCLRVYEETFPGFPTYRKKCKDDIVRQGYVEDLFGKRYRIGEEEAYKAPNAVVQGGCAQLLKIASLQVEEYQEDQPTSDGIHVLLPLHDEFVLERRQSTRVRERDFISSVRECMEIVPVLTQHGIRLRVDVARTKTNWTAKKELIA